MKLPYGFNLTDGGVVVIDHQKAGCFVIFTKANGRKLCKNSKKANSDSTSKIFKAKTAH